jgi:membrane peptidoglycan carboxypeptidase
VFITWQLERFLSKDKILELYLNVIEWGPEVYGLREAAMHYFGRKPQELDLLESAYLASIIPSPIRFHRFFEEGRVPEVFEARVKSVVREMGRRKLASEESVQAALGRRITFAGTAGQGPANPKPGQEEPIPDDEFSE